MEQEIRKYSLCCCETDSVYHEFSVCMGISDTAMRILYIIRMYDGTCLLSEIVRLSGISKQTIHSAIKKLEKEGMLHIENYNGKKKLVSFSKTGETLAKQTVDRLIEIENKILGSYDSKERNLFFEMEHRYMLALKEQVEQLAQERKNTGGEKNEHTII